MYRPLILPPLSPFWMCKRGATPGSPRCQGLAIETSFPSSPLSYRNIVSDDRDESLRRAHHISGAGDRYEALKEVLEHQSAQAARDRDREARELRRQQEEEGAPYWLVAVLLMMMAWLWLLPPSFLRVDPPLPQSIEQEEAALRFAMYVQAQRIKEYREETGRYPTRLEEAGPPLPAMRYDLLTDDLYQLSGVTDRMRLTYQSDLPLREFVGSGAEVIDEAAVEGSP